MLKEKENKKLINVCTSLIKSGDIKGLKKYISTIKRDKSWVGTGGLSLLHLSARYNQIEICQFLLEEGITPDVTESFTKKTSLHIAAYFGHLEVASLLKKFGANLDAKDCITCSPIHYAAMGKQKDMILFFLENRIEPIVQSIFGNVLDILIRKKNFDLVDFISNVDGCMAFDNYYFSKYTPRRSIADSEWTPFHSAAVSGQVEILEMLMQKFPFVPTVKKGLGYSKLKKPTSAKDLALLEGTISLRKIFHLEKDTNEYRKIFMERNWYEIGFPKRKELCDAIRYRKIEKINDIIGNQGIDFFFKEK